MIEQRSSFYHKERALTKKSSPMFWSCLLQNAVAVSKVGEEIQKVLTQMLPSFSSIVTFSKILRGKKNTTPTPPPRGTENRSFSLDPLTPAFEFNKGGWMNSRLSKKRWGPPNWSSQNAWLFTTRKIACLERVIQFWGSVGSMGDILCSLLKVLSGRRCAQRESHLIHRSLPPPRSWSFSLSQCVIVHFKFSCLL